MTTTALRLTNPQGAVIIWNYKERITADTASEPHAVEEVIIGTNEVRGMRTSKSKAQPAGTFEFMLAPTQNWVANITPGSWCAILMSRDVIPEFEDNPIPLIGSGGPGEADQRTLKMFGRIKSVRLAVTVNQQTGARATQYIVTGEDWGTVFNSKIYIDFVLRNTFDKMSAVGQAGRVGIENLTTDYLDSEVKLPSSSTMVSNIRKLWGDQGGLTAIVSTFQNALGGVTNDPESPSPIVPPPIPELPTIASASQYRIPDDVAKFMQFGSFIGASVNFAELIEHVDGVLEGYDTYGGDNDDARGFYAVDKMYGTNTFWQLLTEHSNPAINELVAETRWQGGKPSLALYKRARPFLNRDQFDGSDSSEVVKNKSFFKDVRRVYVPKKDVLSINAGTNLAEKINFVEVLPAPSFIKGNHDVFSKISSQTGDKFAHERNGFNPLIVRPTMIPYNGDNVKIVESTQWKYLLREWHFGKDTMLDGSVSFIGLNEHIGVGDNIMIDASVLGPAFNSVQASAVSQDNATEIDPDQEDQSAVGDLFNTIGGLFGTSSTPPDVGANPGSRNFILAHVEHVENTFEVLDSGARSFVTTVRFVRGVITDSNGELTSGGAFGPFSIGGAFASFGGSKPRSTALDKDVTDMSPEERAARNVTSTKDDGDPKG